MTANNVVTSNADANINGNLTVADNSTLGKTAKVVNAEGTPTVTLDGETGTVTATSGVISSILTVGSLISNSGVLAQLVQTPSISSGSSSTLDIQRKVIGILVNIAVNIFGSLKVNKVGQEGALTESITEIDGGNVTASGNVSGQSGTFNNVTLSRLVFESQSGNREIYLDLKDNVYLDNNFIADGDIKANGDIVGSVKTSTILPMDDSNVITLGAVPTDDPTAVDTVKVEGNLDVTGNLNVKGSTVTQDQETLLVKDNIIVTNSSGAGFSLSGIVMRTTPTNPNNPNSPTQAYGILYSPITEAVMIGEGELKEITDATTGAVTYEFNYYVGKSLPLAARSGFNNIKDGYIPVWDADLYAFVPSDTRISENGNFEGDINVNGNVTGSEASFSKIEIHDGVNGNTITPDFASFNEIRAKNLVIDGIDAATYVQNIVADYIANNGGGGDTAAISELLHKINTGGVE